MSVVHNSGARAVAWVRAHALVIFAAILAIGLVVTIFVTTFRLYDERQARLADIEGLAAENRRLAMENAEQDLQQCEAINGSNETLRFLLDGSIRGRTPMSPPLSEAQRQLTIDTYRRLPSTDCATGQRTYFDPPFPS